jgi:hypothetical protein
MLHYLAQHLSAYNRFNVTSLEVCFEFAYPELPNAYRFLRKIAKPVAFCEVMDYT